MTLTQFTVFDSKVQSSIAPFYRQNRADGLRAWHYNCNLKDSDYNRYPGDYTLFELGEYECDTMTAVDYETPINHGLAQIQITEE